MSDKSKIENVNITRSIKKRMEELRQKDERTLTVAEKIMLRGWEQRATIKFTSAHGGDIEVVMRIPLSVELDHMRNLQNRVAAAAETGDQKANAAATDEMYQLLADLCIDESLDRDFFASGIFLLSDLLEMMQAIGKKQLSNKEDATEFRNQ